MKAEELNLVISVATLLAIGVTALAAVVQLRHLRGSYQLAAVMHLVERFTRPETIAAVEDARSALPARLADPEYRASLGGQPDKVKHPELVLCDFQEQIGSYVRHGLISESLYFDCAAFTATYLWRYLEPVVAIVRRRGGPHVYENFEWLVVRTRAYSQRDVNIFDRRTPPLGAHDPWAADDAAHGAPS